MKKLILIILIVVSIAGFAQQESNFDKPQGFLDRNKDGINDWFHDANGDGINDVDHQPYPHGFTFADQNGDGINDLFIDEDGDGVNDLTNRGLKRDKGWNTNVIDNNRDWINDITGEIYNRRNLMGNRYGFILEERGIRGKDFIDQDGDGHDDRFAREGQRMQRRSMDHFIDQDGDGICDDRGFDRHRYGRKGQGKPK
ncbi:MAG TPA: hypothetical protein DHW42_09835 [Candidatus Marinimicrobia bacterium]|nr:hypothetical protein [Candidatus Neomarinimicrobiota bacterium]